MRQIWLVILTAALAAPTWAAEPSGRELVARFREYAARHGVDLDRARRTYA